MLFLFLKNHVDIIVVFLCMKNWGGKHAFHNMLVEVRGTT